MKTASVKELKDELKYKDDKELVEIVLRLSRFKKENKELLTYLLFEAHHEDEYVDAIKAQMDEQFLSINTRNIYYAKKGIRRILKEAKKYIRYTGNKETEVAVLIHFCRLLQEFQPYYSQSKVLRDICARQIVLIKVRISTLHEDLQYDFEQELNMIDY